MEILIATLAGLTVGSLLGIAYTLVSILKVAKEIKNERLRK